MDSSNQFEVVVMKSGRIWIQALPQEPLPPNLSREEALNLAAWLVALADPEGKEFARLLTEIQGP